MANARYLPKYKNTISDLNLWHSFLLRRMTVGDCRVEYLRTFEIVLDSNCSFPLKENPRYIRLTKRYPLPPPPQKYVTPVKFQVYMELYNYVMRDAGLLNREAELDEDDIDDRADAWD